MKNVFLKITAVFILIILIAGTQYVKPLCAAPAKTKIEFWFSLPHQYLPVMEELIKKFNEEKIYYNVVIRNFEDPSVLLEKLKTGQALPDVAIINAGWQKELIEKGKIENVEDVMDKVGSTLKVVFKMDTFPALLAASIYNDKIWSVPFYAVNQAVLYNPQFLRANKLKVPPKTWDDLLKLGKKISKDGVYSFTIPSDLEDREIARVFASFLSQLGGDLSTSSVGEYEKAMSFFNDLINKYKICSFEEINPDRVVMFVGDPEEYLALKNKGVILKAAPFFATKTRASFFDLYSLVVLKKEKRDPMKIWNFVYWLSEFQQSLAWSLATPYLPAHKQVTLSPEYFQYLQDNPEIAVFLKELAVGKTETDFDNYEDMIKKIGKDFRMLISGSKTVN